MVVVRIVVIVTKVVVIVLRLDEGDDHGQGFFCTKIGAGTK